MTINITNTKTDLESSIAQLDKRLWKGCDVITGLENTHQDTTEALALWLDLLDKYERASDLLKAIEQGLNIFDITGPVKERLNNALTTPDTSIELQHLLTV